VIFITAPALLRDQIATMANRTLKDVTYSDALPISGRCSECGRLFSSPSDTTDDLGRATRDFYTAFAAMNAPRTPQDGPDLSRYRPTRCWQLRTEHFGNMPCHQNAVEENRTPSKAS